MGRKLFAALVAGSGLLSPCAAEELPAREALTLRGDMVQGALVRGQTSAGAKVALNGEALPVSGDGRFVFGFDRDHKDPVTLSVALPDGTEIRRTLTPASREFEIQRIDGLPQKYVTPMDPETLERIKREAALKAAARPKDTPATWYAEDFIWPAKGRISGVYGSQRILNGEPKRPHYGVDVAAPVGTPVVAPAPGRVTLAEKDMYFEGGLVFIDHGHGVISVLMHLSAVFVKAGEDVTQDQKVGAIGATGRSTGPHLDWRMHWRDAMVDPQLLVGPMPADDATPPKAEAAAK